MLDRMRVAERGTVGEGLNEEQRLPSVPKKDGRVRLGELEFAYDVRGSGEPFLVLPGITMRRAMWPDELCDALARAGFQVVRMDNRDAGESSRIRARPPNIPVLLRRSTLGQPIEVPYRLEDMAEDAFGVMRELGHERFHVAGASMGGMIAQTMALLRPDRLHSMTSVMSGPGGRRYAIGKVSALWALLEPMPREREAHIERLVATFRILSGGGLPFDAVAARSLAVAQVDAGVSAAASARQLGAIMESSGRRRALLRSVKTPTLVIHGSHDPLLPLRGAAATARLIPGAALVVVPGMGHNFPAPVLGRIAEAMVAHARGTSSSKRDPVRAERDLPRAARAFRALLKDPDDLPQVFALLEALSGPGHLHDLHARFAASEEGRQLLETKPDIVERLHDRDRLRAMPEGSLGRAYLSFVESENISATGIRDASDTPLRREPVESEIAFVRDRMRDTHDLWHAATGYQGDVLGEIGLLTFTLAQHWNTAIALLVLGGVVKGIGRRFDVLNFVRDAYRRGREAAWLPSQDWEALLERPVDEVRARLRLGAPPIYTPVRTAELRASGIIG